MQVCDVSPILSQKHANILEGWMGKKIGEKIYRASEHGWTGKIMHELCDKEVRYHVLISDRTVIMRET